VLEDENEVHLTVEIEEPSHGMHANLKKVAKVSYRAELEPRAASSVEVLKHSKDNSCRQGTFLSLKKGEEYILTIKTLVNGQTVGQIEEKFNTNKLEKILLKELSVDDDAKREEETPTPQEEEVKVENEDTPPEEEKAEEKEKTKETDLRPPIDIFELQRLSKKMKDQKRGVSLEVVDEKAKDSVGGETTSKPSGEKKDKKIALNLDDMRKTESLPHLASTRPKRKKTQRATQNSAKAEEGTDNAGELKEFEEFFPKV